eukprot:scaffold172272_cov30-Attheya_sp.AAC.1
MVDSMGKSFYWAKLGAICFMMQLVASYAILLNSDSLSSTIVSSPDPFSEPHKYEEGVDSFVIEVWAGDVYTFLQI